MRALFLTVESRILPTFFSFLQAGFSLEARVGCCVREFLRDQCGLADQTIADRIRTVFLDGMPVDDLDRAKVEDNSTLALSGAMPGLVGAVMRSNSPLRSFRASITHGADTGSIQQSQQQQQGMVRVKLFNTVMSELGPNFLREGILLEPLVLKELFAKQAESGWSGFREIMLDDDPIDFARLLDEDLLSGSGLVSLTVRTFE